MVLSDKEAEAIAVVARTWATAATGFPLIIRKVESGAVFAHALPRERFTKGEFAAALNMSRTKFAEIEEQFGMAPSPSDKMYAADTVDTIKRLLWLEEKAEKITGKMRRHARQGL